MGLLVFTRIQAFPGQGESGLLEACCSLEYCLNLLLESEVKGRGKWNRKGSFRMKEGS